MSDTAHNHSPENDRLFCRSCGRLGSKCSCVEEVDLMEVRCRCGYAVQVPQAEVPMHHRAFERWCPHGR